MKKEKKKLLWGEPVDEVLKGLDKMKEQGEEKDRVEEAKRQKKRKAESKSKTDHPDIVILGCRINAITRPRLYRRAAKDPGWVEATVLSMMKAQGFKKPGMPMSILDSDLS